MALWDGGYYSSGMLKGLGPQRPLRNCNIEDIAAHYAHARRSGAVNFANKDTDDEKRNARRLVLDLFGSSRFPAPIKILTMPGSKWAFEAALIKERETPFFARSDVSNGPVRTEFHCFENDRAIYYDAMIKPPGLRHPLNKISDLGENNYCERVTSSLWINRYYFTDVNHLIKNQIGTYDAVWLDYLGPLTVPLLTEIRQFFENRVRSIIVVTSLRARWNKAVAQIASDYDGYSAWVRGAFEGFDEEHCVEYFDSSPMLQVAYSKRAS